jgi:hypothetical protein
MSDRLKELAQRTDDASLDEFIELLGKEGSMPVRLREATTENFPGLLNKLSPPTAAELNKAKQALKDDSKQMLANSYKAAHPNATPAEVAAFVQGRDPGPKSSSLDDSLRRAHPDWTPAAIAAFKRGRA